MILIMQVAAIALIKAKGGITREDPNAVRKEKILPETQERIKKRLIESKHLFCSICCEPVQYVLC